MSAARGEVGIGQWRFPPPEDAQGVALLKWSSSAKLDKKETDGKNDARTTFKGRQTGEVKITLKWKERDAGGDPTKIDEYASKMLADVSPRGPNAGTPFELEAKDQEIHAAYNVIVERLEGPDRVPGAEATAVLTCTTWTKDTTKPVVAKTPVVAQSWSGNSGSNPSAPVPDPPGFSNAATAPQVRP